MTAEKTWLFQAHDANRLAKRLGALLNALETEQDRHKLAVAKITEKLDNLYSDLGAEAASDDA